MQPTQIRKGHAHLLFSLSLGNSYEKSFLEFVNITLPLLVWS